MEKKNETLKTVFAILLLALMLFVVYWLYLKPKSTGGASTATASNGAGRADSPPASAGKQEDSEKGSGQAGTSGKAAADALASGKLIRGPFKPPIHRELAPLDYFSLEEYREKERGLPRHYESVLNAHQFAETKIGRESDKSFAGTAYFSSIEVAPSLAEMKNPFVPLVKKDDVLNRFSTGIDMSFSNGGSSSSSGSSDIWDWFSTPGLPSGGEFVPPANGFSENGTDPVPQFLDVDPNAPVIQGGPAKVLGVALSDKGASALLEVGAAGSREVIRVRTDQILEGRFKVAKIAEDRIVLADLTSGKTFELKFGGASRRFA